MVSCNEKPDRNLTIATRVTNSGPVSHEFNMKSAGPYLPCDFDKKAEVVFAINIHVFFTYFTGAISGRHMYMFSQHRKLDFYKIISFICGLKCLKKL